MSGVVALAAAAVVTAGTGIYEATQQGKISGTELGMAQTQFGEQQGFEQMLQQLIANPSSVSTLPGFQFQLQTGSAAVADQMAASGFSGSGNEAAALTKFGQGLASSFYGQQAGLLAQLSGITAASSPAQSGSAATGASAAQGSTINNLLSQLGVLGGVYSGLYGGGGAATTPAEDAAVGGASTSYAAGLGYGSP
jgi:hypothetical protein